MVKVELSLGGILFRILCAFDQNKLKSPNEESMFLMSLRFFGKATWLKRQIRKNEAALPCCYGPAKSVSFLDNVSYVFLKSSNSFALPVLANVAKPWHPGLDEDWLPRPQAIHCDQATAPSWGSCSCLAPPHPPHKDLATTPKRGAKNHWRFLLHSSFMNISDTLTE